MNNHRNDEKIVSTVIPKEFDLDESDNDDGDGGLIGSNNDNGGESMNVSDNADDDEELGGSDDGSEERDVQSKKNIQKPIIS